jgi:hypothetical protein
VESARRVAVATSVPRVSDRRLEFEIRRLSGVVAVDVRASTVSVLAEPSCDAVALGATLEALLASRGLQQEIRILGGRIPTAVRPHRLSALTMGGVAGIGLLGVATAAALQGALPTPDFQQEHRLAPVAGAPAQASTTTPTTGPRLRIVAGDQPEWAAGEATLVIPSTTTTTSAARRTPLTVQEVLVAAAGRVELPDLALTPVEPDVVVTPTTTPKPTKPVKPTTTTTKPTPTTTPPTVVPKPRPTTTMPLDYDDKHDGRHEGKHGNHNRDKRQGPKTS